LGSFLACVILATVLALVFVWRAAVERGDNPRIALGIVICAIVAGWIGARLLLIPKGWGLFVKYPVQFLLMTGGWAWYGGLVGAWVGTWIFSRATGVPFLKLADILAPVGALGQAIGRVGCQLAGDGDYGIPTNLPWGMAYPHGVVPTEVPVHPTPVYEMIGYFAIFAYLWRRRHRSAPPGDAIGRYLILAACVRFPVEFVRPNYVWLAGLTEAQLFAIAAVALGALLLVRSRRAAAGSSLATTETASCAASDADHRNVRLTNQNTPSASTAAEAASTTAA
jgi:phosphatidylglycerol:prolipoprotein diacylglycerol transferase